MAKLAFRARREVVPAGWEGHTELTLPPNNHPRPTLRPALQDRTIIMAENSVVSAPIPSVILFGRQTGDPRQTNAELTVSCPSPLCACSPAPHASFCSPACTEM